MENLLIETETGFFEGVIIEREINALGIIYKKEKKIVYEGGFEKNEFQVNEVIYNNNKNFKNEKNLENLENEKNLDNLENENNFEN